MPKYVFQAEGRNGPIGAPTSWVLASEMEAANVSFDLLRENPNFDVVKVFVDARPLLTRTRLGGKLDLAWHIERPPPPRSGWRRR